MPKGTAGVRFKKTRYRKGPPRSRTGAPPPKPKVPDPNPLGFTVKAPKRTGLGDVGAKVAAAFEPKK